MPRTLDNHLSGVTATAPHPESYRPDLPLTTRVEIDSDEYRTGYDDGRDEVEAEKDDVREQAYENGRTAGVAEERQRILSAVQSA